MPKKPMTTLIVIFGVVWILILAGTIIIFEFIIPMKIFGGLLNGLVQAGLSLILVLVWLGIFLLMRNRMVKSQFKSMRIEPMSRRE